MTILQVSVLALWGGACWRARGGGAADATGFRFWGTSATRAIFALAMLLPLLLLTWHAILLVIAFWAGWSIVGWGAFQGMAPGPHRPNTVATALDAAGLHDVTVWYDFAGMAIEGLICLALPALATAAVLAWRASPDVSWHAVLLRAAIFWLAGLMFAPLYLAGDRLPLPAIGRFVGGQAWREVFVGAWVLPVLFWALAG